MLWNFPLLAIALVESLSFPALSSMMIWIGLCVPSDVPFTVELLYLTFPKSARGKTPNSMTELR